MKLGLVFALAAITAPFARSQPTKESAIQPAAKFVLSLALIALTLGLVPPTHSSAEKRLFSQAVQPRIEENSSAQDGKDVRPLVAGNPIEREMAKGEVHFYKTNLAAGQYLQVDVEQRGIDVLITVFGPDDKKLVEVSGPVGRYKTKWVAIIAEIPGSYRVEVRQLFERAGPGRYEIRVTELRAATPRDRTLVAARQDFLEGEQLSQQRDKEPLRKSLAKYEAALQLYRTAGERRGEAETLRRIGTLYRRLDEQPRALDYYQQALQVWRAIGDGRGEAATLNSLGQFYNSTGDKQKALDFHQQALTLLRSANDLEEEGFTLGLIAQVYGTLGEGEKSVDYRRRQIAAFRALGDRQGELILLSNLGVNLRDMGENLKALDVFQEMLARARALGERSQEAAALGNLASVYSNLGEAQRALDLYLESLSHPALDPRWQISTLHNIGTQYQYLGEYQKSLDYLGRALEASRAAASPYSEAYELASIGETYIWMGEYQKALTHFNQALSLSQQVRSAVTESTALTGIGSVSAELGEKQKALDHFNRALAILRGLGDRPRTANLLIELGALHRDLGEREKALDFHKEAFSLYRDMAIPWGEAKALHGMALVNRDRGELTEAHSQISAALKIVESLRTKVTSSDLRSSYFASVHDYYELEIDLLMRLHRQRPSEGYAAAALQVSERARARSLLETLSEARADIRQGADPALLERERALQQQLKAQAARQMNLFGAQHTPEQAAIVKKELEALTTEYQQVQARIRVTSPRYAALTQPQPLNLKEIQTEVLDAETLLLEYALGKDASYLWAVTPTSITSYELPKRAEIEEAARQVYAHMARTGPARSGGSGQRGLGIAQTQRSYVEAANRLSQMLLSPVAAQLGKKRLVIVSDGALQFIPFAALPIPAVGRGVNFQPLIAKHEIVSLPSASTLAVLRRETDGRAPAPKAIAVLADPVFERSDERLKRSNAQPEAGNVPGPTGASAERGLSLEVTKTAEESGVTSAGVRIPRLPGTKREAEQILALVPATGRKAAFDFAANHATATSPELSQYRYVHFATHGFLNSQHPELSGIMLSMFDEEGRPQDGFLRAHEVFNLKLPAELVVLSACQTGLGKEVRGEGLVGLTRGFMYAGAPRVVVSLWNVSDEATAELMTRFYRKMLQDKMRPAAALRSAQVSLMREKKWSSPFYWAAFTLQGEWR